ncbi:MAG: ferrous iron transporter B, partial [Clostridia bacterium]|nr:ferrous iron transporter B [Clostridia bacterium]
EPKPREEFAAFLPGETGEEASAACLNECTRLLEGVVTETERGKRRLTERLDRIAAGKYTALPLMLLMLLGVFYLTIIGANYPSGLLSRGFSAAENALRGLFGRLNVAPWLTGAVLDGMFRTVGWVVSVMLPPMAIFFPLFTLLEDLGYLPRAAFCADRCFRCAGSCGKQALTVMMGFGCNAAGVVGCRIIPGEKERLAAIVTNSLVPCNGRFPLIIALSSIFLASSAGGAAGLTAAFVLLAVLMTLLMTFLLSKTLLRGEESGFLMELPPYRPPKLGQVLIRSVLDRTLHVLGRAAAVAAPAGLIIYALANIRLGGGSLLSAFCEFLDPFARFFGLDGTILAAFILGFPANEIVLPIALLAYTSSGSLAELGSYRELWSVLSANGWTGTTALSVILFSMFHWPCSTTCLTIRREAGTKWMLLSMLLPTAVGLLLLALVNGAIRLFS